MAKTTIPGAPIRPSHSPLTFETSEEDEVARTLYFGEPPKTPEAQVRRVNPFNPPGAPARLTVAPRVMEEPCSARRVLFPPPPSPPSTPPRQIRRVDINNPPGAPKRPSRR